MNNRVIAWGGTGQIKIMRPIIEADGSILLVIFDDTDGLVSPFQDIPLYHGSTFGTLVVQKTDRYIVCIGNPHSDARMRIGERMRRAGMRPWNFVHVSAVIHSSLDDVANLQVSPNVNIGVDVEIGDYCIINSNANVEHDCVLGDGVEIGPSAVVCGCVEIGDHTWIGAGAVIKDHLSIGSNSIVGAGAMVIKDVPDNIVVVGNPARHLRVR
jgi:sugar O-acyltransferase (sialic acid O-acetyltransferase NeuD family)